MTLWVKKKNPNDRFLVLNNGTLYASYSGHFAGILDNLTNQQKRDIMANTRRATTKEYVLYFLQFQAYMANIPYLEDMK